MGTWGYDVVEQFVYWSTADKRILCCNMTSGLYKKINKIDNVGCHGMKNDKEFSPNSL